MATRPAWRFDLECSMGHSNEYHVAPRQRISNVVRRLPPASSPPPSGGTLLRCEGVVSGLAVIYERDGAPAEEARITRMLERLRRRGPDRNAHRCLGEVALGHCMLETTPEDALDREPLESASNL